MVCWLSVCWAMMAAHWASVVPCGAVVVVAGGGEGWTACANVVAARIVEGGRLSVVPDGVVEPATYDVGVVLAVVVVELELLGGGLVLAGSGRSRWSC